MRPGTVGNLGILGAIATMTACGGAASAPRPLAAPSGQMQVPVRVVAGSGCARVHPAPTTATPLGAVRAGSTLVLATQGGTTLAYAADEDDQTVHVVDVDAGKELGAVALEGRPSQIMFLPDGRLAVLLRDRSKIEVLEPGVRPGTLEARCTVDTALEPVALARTPDDATILVYPMRGPRLASRT